MHARVQPLEDAHVQPQDGHTDALEDAAKAVGLADIIQLDRTMAVGWPVGYSSIAEGERHKARCHDGDGSAEDGCS